MPTFGWIGFALVGALMAAIVSVINKKALDRLDVVVAVMVQALCMFLTLAALTTGLKRWPKLVEAPREAIGLICVSGIAAGLAWFFGYRALQLSSVAKSTPIDRLSLVFAVVLAMVFLRERPSTLNWTGIVLMLIGAFCVAQTSTK